jgi:hypothetical protein
MNRTEFLSYFLWWHQDDDSYLPPAEGALEQALAVATDRIGVEAYQPQFDAIVEIVKTDEAVGRWGSRNLKNSPGITRLTTLPPDERAKYIVAAMQVLSWFDQCAGLIEARRPLCAIGQSVAGTIIDLAGKFKGYPPEQLGALVRASASWTSTDLLAIMHRSNPVQIMASHASQIPRDPETRAALAQFLTNVAGFQMLRQADLKAIDKLRPIASGEEPAVETSTKKPKSAAKTSPKTSQQESQQTSAPKAVRDSVTFWELPGESELRAATTPEPPQANKQAAVRLTHANPYGPFDEAKFFVRIGDPEKPTDQDNPDAATDWVQCRLVEELLHVDGREIPRAKGKEPFEDETPWEGTYEAKLKMPAQRCSIEIKVVSHHPELPYVAVLSNWQIAVG